MELDELNRMEKEVIAHGLPSAQVVAYDLNGNVERGVREGPGIQP
jgi:hypothetical protein